MADSSDDLRREMEEFERDEAEGHVEVPAAATGPTGGRRLPTWVYAMFLVDIVIIVVVLFVFVF